MNENWQKMVNFIQTSIPSGHNLTSSNIAERPQSLAMTAIAEARLGGYSHAGA
jgi:hypothetical protein